MDDHHPIAPERGSGAKEPLKARWNIDTVVLRDVVDGLRGEFAGEGAYTHRSENGAACGEVTPEGAA